MLQRWMLCAKKIYEVSKIVYLHYKVRGALPNFTAMTILNAPKLLFQIIDQKAKFLRIKEMWMLINHAKSTWQ